MIAPDLQSVGNHREIIVDDSLGTVEQSLLLG
jgi:hypothetical protein